MRLKRPEREHCTRSNFFGVRERYANSDDVGYTVIRQPAGERRVQLWKDEFYGPLPKVEPKSGAAD